MKIFRQIALIAALVSLFASGPARSQIYSGLLPPQTILGNMQGSETGAQALKFCEVAVAMSQVGYLISSYPLSCDTLVPPPTRTPGNAIVFGPSPTQNIIVDGGGPPILAGGTPSSLILTNASGLPISTGLSGLGAGVAAWAAVPSSANLATAVTDETGTGSLVFATSPTLVTPNLGTPSAGVGTNLTSLNATQLTTGTVPAARLPFNSATLNGAPSNPTGTASPTLVMSGLGVTTCRITPAVSSRVQVIFTGAITSSSAGGVTTIRMQQGTGAGPANGTGVSGTAIGNANAPTFPSANQKLPFTLAGIITGLTPATAIWLDVAIASSAGTGVIDGISCISVEL